MTRVNSRSVSPFASPTMPAGSEAKPSRKRRRPSETQAHRSQEKKRRQLINGSIVRLKELVPACEDMRVTMVNVLQATESYIVEMQTKQAQLEAEIRRLRGQAASPGLYPVSSLAAGRGSPSPSSSPSPSLASVSPPALAPVSPPSVALAALPAAPLAAAPPPAPVAPVLLPTSSPRLAPVAHALPALPQLTLDPADIRMALSKVHGYPPAAHSSVTHTFAANNTFATSPLSAVDAAPPPLSRVDFLSPDLLMSFM